MLDKHVKSLYMQSKNRNNHSCSCKASVSAAGHADGRPGLRHLLLKQFSIVTIGLEVSTNSIELVKQNVSRMSGDLFAPIKWQLL